MLVRPIRFHARMAIGPAHRILTMGRLDFAHCLGQWAALSLPPPAPTAMPSGGRREMDYIRFERTGREYVISAPGNLFQAPPL